MKRYTHWEAAELNAALFVTLADHEAEVERLTRAVESEATHGATLEIEIRDLCEVIGRLLYTSGPITPGTPCRCGATQPAHYCDFEVEARRDALRLIERLGTGSSFGTAEMDCEHGYQAAGGSASCPACDLEKAT